MGVGGSRGRLADLLSKDLRRTTIMLWIIWLAASFSYYGVVLMSTELFESSGQLCSLDGSVEESCSAQCHPLATSDYNHLLWSTSSSRSPSLCSSTALPAAAWSP